MKEDEMETTKVDVGPVLQAKLAELEAEKKALVETRDAELSAARDKYKDGLKAINARINKTKRMMAGAEKL